MSQKPVFKNVKKMSKNKCSKPLFILWLQRRFSDKFGFYV